MRFLVSFATLVAFVIGVQIDQFYDHATAEQLSWLSSAAYCDPTCISSWTCNNSLPFGNFTTTMVFSDPNTETMGYTGFTVNNGFQGVPFMPGLSVNDPVAIVAFRGTVPSDLDNWITDLNAIKTTWSARLQLITLLIIISGMMAPLRFTKASSKHTRL